MSDDPRSTRPSRGRPRGFETEAALDAAMLTFWRRGFHGTSMDDLVAATHASRASLYQEFGDKRQLFATCLARYGRAFDDRVTAILAREPNNRRALTAILNASADRLSSDDAPAGCLRCNSTLELAGSDDGLATALDEVNAAYTATVRRVIARAQAAGELSDDDAARWPVIITGVVNGMVLLARSGASRADLGVVVEHALSSLPATFGR
ncbi:MAG: TetR/AcrR family transcriptional regulator [Pseudomonadota bacterium]